ncbi:MAG: Fe-S protein assembly chaperone HscA [Bacteroidetes bacterium]|nr:Fe-S protein assembly chaperone HscA [Bacteroidota bacterium]
MAKFSINIQEGILDKDESEIIIGIDLGTTNSLVAHIVEGQAVAVKGENKKSSLVPSIIHFDPNGEILVGDAAKNKLVSDPQNTIYSVKRLMGKSYRDVENYENYFGYKIIDDDPESLVKIRVENSFYTPIDLSALILKELKKRIEKLLGKIVSKAVITVPAYFNDAQRQATRDAGKLAGLDVLRIVNEPTAASLSYGLGNQQEEAQTIAVYDLGGGTFDISILKIQDGIFEVLATNGNTFLGGDDFDRAIMDYWIERSGFDKSELIKNKELSQELRLMAEIAKKKFSKRSAFSGQIDEISCDITLDKFEELISPFVQETIKYCKNALKDAKLQVSDIDHIVMVGGSTRVRLVRKTVSDYFGKEVYDKVNPDEVVALGAAIQADILAGNQKDMLLLDVTPLSQGIETVGGLMDVIIPRNSKVPTKAGRQYTTSVDGQKNLKVAVFQGERDLVEHNRKLGEFILRNIPPMPAGLPKIEISFILNADGILKVNAKELRSGMEQEIEVKPSYGINEEEMALMLLDSIQHAEEDMKQRSLLEAKNEAKNMLLAADKFINQNLKILTKEEIEKTLQLAKVLNDSLGSDDKDLVNQAIDDLNTYTTPLAHRSMDTTIVDAMKGKKI